MDAFFIRQGDTESHSFTLYTEGVVQNVTTATVALHYDMNGVTFIKAMTSAVPTSGVVTVTWTPAETALIPAGTYRARIVITFLDTSVRSWPDNADISMQVLLGDFIA